MIAMKVEQLFYGSGNGGYRILASSPGAELFREPFLEMCGAVGTPDGYYHGETILLSRPCGGSLIVAKGGFGKADSAGRRTLFFHGLVLSQTDAVASGADVFRLVEERVFSEVLPAGVVDGFELTIGKKDSKGGICSEYAFPAVFVGVKQPSFDLVKDAVVGHTFDVAFATHCFWENTLYQCYALSVSAPVPSNADLYNLSGKLLRKREDETKSPIINLPKKCENEQSHPGVRPSQRNHSLLGIASLILNAILLGALIILAMNRKESNAPVMVSPTTDAPSVEKTETETQRQTDEAESEKPTSISKELKELREISSQMRTGKGVPLSKPAWKGSELPPWTREFETIKEYVVEKELYGFKLIPDLSKTEESEKKRESRELFDFLSELLSYVQKNYEHNNNNGEN